MNTINTIKSKSVLYRKQIITVIVVGILSLIYLSLYSKNPNFVQIQNQNSFASKQGYVSADLVYVESDESFAVSRVAGMPYPGEPQTNTEGQYSQGQERKLVKTGTLSMVVKDITKARDIIFQTVDTKGGFISSQNFKQEYNGHQEQAVSTKNGSLSIRVPNEKFEETVTELRAIALVVTNEYTNTNDVTEQYADLNNRLENKLQEESQYRLILKKATKVSDILEVTRYIEQARSDAERMRGQLNALGNTIVMSTLQINLDSEKQYEIGGVSWSPIDTVKESYYKLIAGLTSVVDTLLSFVVLLPLLLIYIVLLWVAYKFASKAYKKFIK